MSDDVDLVYRRGRHGWLFLRGYSEIVTLQSSTKRRNTAARDSIPGGNPFGLFGCCWFVVAETVASKSLRRTMTQPGRKGKTAA